MAQGPVYAYWTTEGAEDIAVKMLRRRQPQSNPFKQSEIRAAVMDTFDGCDEVEQYSDSDVTDVSAAVARELYKQDPDSIEVEVEQ